MFAIIKEVDHVSDFEAGSCCLLEIKWCLILVLSVIHLSNCGENDYNVVHKDSSFEFGYDTPDSYHYADANRNNVVRGEFGGRSPKTGLIDKTVYTAGPRGYRPRGRNVVRKYDLNQRGPRPVGSPDDPYYDPYEDPSYNFGFRTRTQSRQENADRVGDVRGRYSFIDDVGEKHIVEYIAGEKTGFHVKTPFPDSNPRAYGPLYFHGKGRPIPRGRTSIQKGLDGSYRFVSTGPDQRRTEVSDATGHVRGSYTYLDDKGVQHSVHYIAGPETGYRVLKNVKGAHLPTTFPFSHPNIIPPGFDEIIIPDVGDIFDGAASGDVRPQGTYGSTNGDSGIGKKPKNKTPLLDDKNNKPDSGDYSPEVPGRPNFDGDDLADDDTDDFDLFGDDNNSKRPASKPGSGKPSIGKPITSTTVGYPSKRPGSNLPETGDKFGAGSEESSPASTGSEEANDSKFEDKTPYVPGSGAVDSSRPGEGRPSNRRPGGGTPGSPGVSKPDFGRPANGRPESNRPGSGRPGISRPGNGQPGGKKPGSTTKPDYSYDDYDVNNVGTDLYKPPPFRPGRPHIHIDDYYDDYSPCRNCKGTVITNFGHKPFLVPPGQSARAHVQTIDLVPAASKIISPSEQLKRDVSGEKDQLNEEPDTIINKKLKKNNKWGEQYKQPYYNNC